MKKIVLDTNAFAQYLNGDENVLNAIVRADVVYMSIFVLGELYAAFRGGSKQAKNKDMLERFLQKPTVEILPATSETSEIYGELSTSMAKTGVVLPINDIWIASQAIETGSVMITNDARFTGIPGLRLWDMLKQP
jgi:tRNA(fMet)-specific endonuclease VapC